MKNNMFWSLFFPAASSAIAWLATRWYERKRHRAETTTVEVGNTRSEIENYKLIAAEWREAAQKWKDLVDEYQSKLIDNAKRIDELFEENVELRRQISAVKGSLTKAQNRIKELENKRK